MNTKLGSALVLLVAALLGACGDDDAADDADAMETKLPSGSKCETGSTLTYDSFARAFFEEYCVHCHSRALTGTARNGAPPGVDFDSLAAARAVTAEVIDSKAVFTSTPSGTPMMPIGTPTPDTTTRAQLGVWLACDMP